MTRAWQKTLFQLIARTSTDLPADVEQALQIACKREENANARSAFDTMLADVDLARRHQRPICQDTGAMLFWVAAPPQGISQGGFRRSAEAAIVDATEAGLLRQNCVDTLSGRNTGNNLGDGSPTIHWREHQSETVEVDLILKGGGCENVGTQYALPDSNLKAGRDLEGVRRCVLDAVTRAQGRGCAPGVLGVAIGGDRASGYAESKRLLLRQIGQRSEHLELAELERRLLHEANSLGIGPMGFGGRTTLLDLFIGCRARIPASYFVSISYMCWAYRRRGLVASSAGELIENR